MEIRKFRKRLRQLDQCYTITTFEIVILIQVLPFFLVFIFNIEVNGALLAIHVHCAQLTNAKSE